ncbi:MAG: AraC family transcriptional regulator [Leptolyngbyaceae bacterium]|nr:AraC family transcriptional regulator [Leptolyngbyaceae bacterium]
MAIALSETTWDELWREQRKQSHQTDPGDPEDLITVYPSRLASGYKRDIELRNGISLTLHNYTVHDDFTVIDGQCAEADADCLEFVFNVSSTNRYWHGSYVTSGQHYLIAPSRLRKFYCEELAKEPKQAVDIHLDPMVFKGLMGLNTSASSTHCSMPLPADLEQIIEGENGATVSPFRTITPAMGLALEQILNCPYRGGLKQTYLESKSVELLVLFLDQAIAEASEPSPIHSLLPDDVERIHQAQQILTEKMDNPPSLTALARQVGLNDRKLKQGFRQVFKTTVFGYLHHCRMEKAQQLLQQQQTVAMVAATVGYASPTAFNAAFRRKYGTNPKAYQLAHRSVLF